MFLSALLQITRFYTLLLRTMVVLSATGISSFWCIYMITSQICLSVLLIGFSSLFLNITGFFWNSMYFIQSPGSWSALTRILTSLRNTAGVELESGANCLGMRIPQSTDVCIFAGSLFKEMSQLSFYKKIIF